MITGVVASWITSVITSFAAFPVVAHMLSGGRRTSKASEAGTSDAPPPSSSSSSSKVQRCCRCKRDSNTANPCPRKHTGPCLSFTSKTSAECLSCRNWANGPGQKIEGKELVANLRDQHCYEQYMKSLNDFEVLFDSEPGRLSRADAQAHSRIISRSHSRFSYTASSCVGPPGSKPTPFPQFVGLGRSPNYGRASILHLSCS